MTESRHMTIYYIWIYIHYFLKIQIIWSRNIDGSQHFIRAILSGSLDITDFSQRYIFYSSLPFQTSSAFIFFLLHHVVRSQSNSLSYVSAPSALCNNCITYIIKCCIYFLLHCKLPFGI